MILMGMRAKNASHLWRHVTMRTQSSVRYRDSDVKDQDGFVYLSGNESYHEKLSIHAKTDISSYPGTIYLTF